MKILSDILYNLGILVSFTVISSIIEIPENTKKYYKIIQGTLFGTASVIGMLNSIHVLPGLMFDGRTIMISICSMFFGPVSGIITGTIVAITRIIIGGQGIVMGLTITFFAVLIGLYFHYGEEENYPVIKTKQLLEMSITVHIIMIITAFILPWEKAIYTINTMWIPVLILYPLITLIIGKILSMGNEKKHMIEELNRQYKITSEKEKNFRNLFENSADPIIIVKNQLIIDCNQSAAEVFSDGKKNFLLRKSLLDISYFESSNIDIIESEINKNIALCEENKHVKFLWNHSDFKGNIIPAEIVLTKIEFYGEEVFHGLIRNISERKKLEKELENLSYYDYLTGLYNRRFFEEELKRLDVERNLPITLIMADVNGLKLINDSFGHSTGDKLLVKVAESLKNGCRSDDIISRMGGDEFVILLTKTDAIIAEAIVDRIKILSAKEKIDFLDISVSFGWSTKISKEEDINDILKTAEDYLYKKKLFESPSVRSKTIQTIISTLYEKNKKEKIHSEKVSEICEKFGQALNLNDNSIKELKTLGLIHDIGKIAIDQSVLNKDKSFIKSEWQEMKKHPEIGYRILSTVPEMAEMAEYVLSHHERPDGKGYPRGITDKNIPLYSKIVAIADAFDAMTGDRPYRDKLSKEESLNELKANSKTQFDSSLIKLFEEKIIEKL